MRTIRTLSIVAHHVRWTENVQADIAGIASVHGAWLAMVFRIALACGLREQLRGVKRRRGTH